MEEKNSIIIYNSTDGKASVSLYARDGSVWMNQKVRELFALSSDYDATDKATQMFFAETQNKLLYTVTGNTAAEIIISRADASQPNMGLPAGATLRSSLSLGPSGCPLSRPLLHIARPEMSLIRTAPPNLEKAVPK